MSFPIVCTRCNYGCYTVGEELGGPGWVELSKQPKNEENTAKWEAFLKEKYAEFAAERKKKKDEQRALKKKPPR